MNTLALVTSVLNLIFDGLCPPREDMGACLWSVRCALDTQGMSAAIGCAEHTVDSRVGGWGS